MKINQNISQLISTQLPEYIRSDPTYSKFVSFVQAYYEWMEQQNNVLFETKNLLSYADIDSTSEEFLKYFTQEFLQYFPEEALIDKALAVKVAKDLYKSKGTLASYQFLFRVLFNSDFDVFFTKEAVLRASDGAWYVSKSLKLATNDHRFLGIQNLRLFGEISKSIATIESSVVSGNKIEVFISNIERLFQSGEFVRVVDNNNQDVIVNGTNLRAKINGQISQIKIDPNKRGLLYTVGDPVIIYGGVNDSVDLPVEATAYVGKTTTGSIQQIGVLNGGFGYRDSPNTTIQITNSPGAIATVGSIVSTLPPTIIINNGGTGYRINDYIISGNAQSYSIFADVTGVNGSGAITDITYRTAIDPNTLLGITANVISANILASNASITLGAILGDATTNATFITSDTIDLKIQEPHAGHNSGFLLGNTSNPVSFNFAKMPTANINTKLSDAFSFTAFQTYAISSIAVQNGGGGAVSLPQVTAKSGYITDVYDPLDSANTLGQNIQGNLANMGILAPIQIIRQGIGYQANDKIVFTGGSGYGAAANVTSVDVNGGITAIDFVYPTNIIEYPLGGMGYRLDALPTLSVNSANVSANGAIVVSTGLLGTSAKFSLSVDRIGAVTTINVSNYGEDYISTPNVSLRVQDIVVSNAAISNLPQKNDIVYQGDTLNTASYIARVNSISLLTSDIQPELSKYNLRVFEYNFAPKPQQQLKFQNSDVILDMANTAYAANFFYAGSPEYDVNGIKVYGNGTAKASATFLDGLTISQGEYLNTRGHPSSFSILQDENYNNYTYQITVDKEISKYREILLNLLHPSGMKVIGRYAMKSTTKFDFIPQSALYTGKSLADYSGSISSNITIIGSFTNKSNNIVKFNNLAGANLASFINSDSELSIKPQYGDSIKSDVVSVDFVNDTVTLKDNVWVTFANVAYASGNTGANTLNVIQTTDSYDIVNNGNYSNTQNHLVDLVFVGDNLKIDGNTFIVNSVDYHAKQISLNSNLTANISNSLISINRTIIAGGTISTKDQIIVLGPVGVSYVPEIATESGEILTSEDNRIIILG